MTAPYSFASHYFDRSGLRLHYVDEGRGEPVVMLHGNPTWSYYYRNVVAALRDRFRCVVPDHIGCGLSDKPQPPRYDYSLQSRVDDLTALLDHLGVRENVTLVLHDWGGMIGMAWAVRNAVAVKRLVVLNTAAFHLPKAKWFPFRLWLGRSTRLGTWLIRSRNLFCRHAAKVGVKRKPLPPEVREWYLRPYDSWDNRVAVLKFVQTIPLEPTDPGYEIVSEVESALPNFANTPTLICWGMKDFVFDHHFLEEWERRMPHAEVHRFADCGHYILEDASDEVVSLVERFVTRR
ncbi:MAG TPA: alpha/beta fold hydrolase [Gemmataceae bacterium]|nr:alpha/beta fold hydrolase [Gemmataceae bacterium]